MRLYELTRELGISNEQANIWMAPRSLGASNSVPKDLEDLIRSRATGRQVGAAAVPKDALDVYKEEVQKVVNQIVQSYGTDWCDDGVSEVNSILGKVGLTITPKMESATLSLTLQLENFPDTSDKDRKERGRYDVPIGMCRSLRESFKEQLSVRLARSFEWTDPDTGQVHVWHVSSGHGDIDFNDLEDNS
jgi:hypothetical protein